MNSISRPNQHAGRTGNPETVDVPVLARESAGETVRLENAAGMIVNLHRMGAGIGSIRIPAPGGMINAVLGYADIGNYGGDPYYLGSTIGRYANRIENARMAIDGRAIELAATVEEPGHSLHGGPKGFSHRRWQLDTANELTASFSLLSPDGDQGFPGTVEAQVTYSLLDEWKLLIAFQAATDAPTVINMANHAYFNLNRDEKPADNHHLAINADRFTPVKNSLVPTGEIRNVAGTPFDFREMTPIAERLGGDSRQLRIGQGFDHNFVLNRVPGGTTLAARLYSPDSGLQMKVFTTQPAMQLYTGQHLAEPFAPFAGICLETQHPPNAPNTQGFPGTVLRPGQVYQHLNLYEFSMPLQSSYSKSNCELS